MAAPDIPPPSYAPLGGLQVDANGRVTYDFEGHVHAVGLDLDAGGTQSDTATDKRVRWLDDAGDAIADVFGWLPGGVALSAGGSSVTMDSTGVYANAAGGGAVLQLINDSGQSEALRFAQQAPKWDRIDYGVSAINFPNNALATPVFVTHHLGVPPVVVLLTQMGAVFGVQNLVWDPAGTGGSSFEVRAGSNGPLNGNVSFAWLAIG